MRINNPRLFNGNFLATQDQIAKWLGFKLPDGAGVEVKEFTGQISAALIPISGITADAAGQFVIDAKTIKLDTTGAVTGTIADKFATIDEAITNVEKYDVLPGEGITVAKAAANGTTSFTISNDFELKKLDDAVEGFAASYQLQDSNGKGFGDTINIPRDQFLSGAAYDATTSALVLTFAINEKDADGVETTTAKEISIPASSFVHEYTAGDGIAFDATTASFNLEKDANVDSKFLQIGDDTIGLSGITDAITTATSGKLDTTTFTTWTGDYANAAAVKAAADATADNALNTFKTDEFAPVSAQVTTNKADIADIRTRAVEMFETTLTFGGEATAAAPGRVIAVYDANNETVYPTITYANGASTLSAATEIAATYTVVYVAPGVAKKAEPEA